MIGVDFAWGVATGTMTMVVVLGLFSTTELQPTWKKIVRWGCSLPTKLTRTPVGHPDRVMDSFLRGYAIKHPSCVASFRREGYSGLRLWNGKKWVEPISGPKTVKSVLKDFEEDKRYKVFNA